VVGLPALSDVTTTTVWVVLDSVMVDVLFTYGTTVTVVELATLLAMVLLLTGRAWA
jgi:hypothetical protein